MRWCSSMNRDFVAVCQLRFFRQEEKFFGPGVARLLAGIGETGSIRAAAAAMDMAYSKAWRILKTAEKHMGFKLLDAHAGGRAGGGARLTPQCADFLRRYTDFAAEISAEARRLKEKYFGE